MFLKDIQGRPLEGMMRIAFKKIQEAGRNAPEILHLFRFKKRSTNHLVRFTEEVMRGPSSLSRGLRELIGAFVSSRNQCGFCSCAHTPVAAHLLGQDLVDEVLHDPETSRLDAAHKELFRYAARLAENPALVGAADIDRLKQAGWSEAAIYDTLTVVSLFKFYNTWNNGSGVQAMSAADYAHSGNRLVTLGYCMDFSLVGILKVMWLGRSEITVTDFKELVKGWLGIKGAIAPSIPSKRTTVAVNTTHSASGSGSRQSCAAPRLEETLGRLSAGGSGGIPLAPPA